MKQIHVGLIGFGTVGSGLAQTLYNQQDRLMRKVGAQVVLSRVADINIDSLPEQFSETKLSKDANDIFTDPGIQRITKIE